MPANPLTPTHLGLAAEAWLVITWRPVARVWHAEAPGGVVAEGTRPEVAVARLTVKLRALDRLHAQALKAKARAERDEEILQAILDGLPYPAIGAIWGVSTPIVAEVARVNGVTIPKHVRNKRISDARRGIVDLSSLNPRAEPAGS
jgi:hypothetical protein